jgi:hypothetical protein
MSPELISALLGIILIDLIVSGDNAVVIGMAVHRLLPRQRRFAILFVWWRCDRPAYLLDRGRDAPADAALP